MGRSKKRDLGGGAGDKADAGGGRQGKTKATAKTTKSTEGTAQSRQGKDERLTQLRVANAHHASSSSIPSRAGPASVEQPSNQPSTQASASDRARARANARAHLARTKRRPVASSYTTRRRSVHEMPFASARAAAPRHREFDSRRTPAPLLDFGDYQRAAARVAEREAERKAERAEQGR